MIPDLSIPGKPFTFRTLAQAQAAGDIQALTKSLAPRTPARRPTMRRTRSGHPRKKLDACRA